MTRWRLWLSTSCYHQSRLQRVRLLVMWKSPLSILDFFPPWSFDDTSRSSIKFCIDPLHCSNGNNNSTSGARHHNSCCVTTIDEHRIWLHSNSRDTDINHYWVPTINEQHSICFRSCRYLVFLPFIR